MSGVQCCNPNQPSIRAVLGNNGLFAINSGALLMFRLNDSIGMPINPDNLTLSIQDFNGITIQIKDQYGSIVGTQVTAQKIADGFFQYDWFIDPSLSIGKYTATWKYDLENSTYTIQQVVTVVQTANISACDQRLDDMVTSLKRLLCCALSVPRYNQQAKPSADCKTFYFTKQNWNTNPGQTRIYRNGHTIVTDGLTVDYSLGKVVFDYPISTSDWISADYSFSWFQDDALKDFVAGAVSLFNSAPPFSKYTVCNVPDYLSRGIIYKASTDAIRQLIMCLQFPQPAQLFGGPERAQQIASTLQTLKKNYEGDWRLMYEQKKFGPWPKSKWLSTPEYSMPGGRSRWFRMMFTSGI